ncbi:MAG: SRPBCC domain-containing protein [Desulfuromonadales bacterium]|nr:SRPBCC domain-containing protein [Desulfuromonadales bacterium]
MKIHTEITLDAPFDRVRELLADTGLYPQWNPLFPQVSGAIGVGKGIDVSVALPAIKPFVVRATVREADAGRLLCWRYRYPLPGLFSWIYRYEIVELERDRVQFVQDSTYAGLLAPLYYLGMKGPLQVGMAELNKAVQRWGERRGISCLKC